MGKKNIVLPTYLADADLKLIKIFIAVTDCGGVSAAELELNLSNSTITNYLSDLEKRLGIKLCERGRKGFSLTEHGTEVYQAAQELFSALGRFTQRVNDLHEQILGDLRIGIADHMAADFQPHLIKALELFLEQAPEVRIHIDILESDDVISQVLDGRQDVGITIVQKNVFALEELMLFDEVMNLYCSNNHSLYELPEDEFSESILEQYRFVASPGFLPGRATNASSKLWNMGASAFNQEARAALILTGQFIGFLPAALVQERGWSNRLKALNSDSFSYSNRCSLIKKKVSKEPLITQLFHQCIQRAYEK